MNPPDPEPMMSLDKFMEQTGVSPTTAWRWRKKGMLTTVNICGRHYILRSEIARFARAAIASNSQPSRYCHVGLTSDYAKILLSKGEDCQFAGWNRSSSQ
jgi:hypothetical protein